MSKMSDVTPYTLPDGLMAMTEDDGTVVTLVQRDPEHGAVYRHDAQWLPLVDPSVLNGLSFVGVSASSEPIFDKYEEKDQLVTIGHYLPSVEGPTWPDPVRIYEEPEHAGEVVVDEGEDEGEEEEAEIEEEAGSDEEAVTASIVLNSADDLDIAIAAALHNHDLRWFVERRVAALGLDASLPWLEN